MTTDQLRAEVGRFSISNNIEDNKELLNIFLEFMITVIHQQGLEGQTSRLDNEARLIFQMMFTKTLALSSLLNGIEYNGKNASLNQIIDPTIIGVIVRNVFETAALFNLIYRSSKSNDERIILHSLWVLSGLAYRQKFEGNISSNENQKKLEFERQEIGKIVKEIEETNLYKTLESRDQEKIKTRIKQKEYLMKFENNRVFFLSWHELINVMNVRPEFMKNMYSYFSLYSHPSNVSVFQFGAMFNDAEYRGQTTFKTEYFFQLLSIFIADYIAVFPTVLKIFELHSIREQILINNHNLYARGLGLSINNCYEALG